MANIWHTYVEKGVGMGNNKISFKTYDPPKKWIEFAEKEGITELYFLKDNSVKNSFHFDRKIYLNIRNYNWKNLKDFLNVHSYPEAMTCKFLHEIGHIIFNHKEINFGTEVSIEELDAECALEKISIKRILSNKYERKAWNYVKEFHKRCTTDYLNLRRSFKKWYNGNSSTSTNSPTYSSGKEVYDLTQ